MGATNTSQSSYNEEMVNVVYDPILNLYFDSLTNSYY